MIDGTIICISSGLLKPKKNDNEIARKHLYLNYGLVSLASILESKGHSVKIFHGNFTEPLTFYKYLLERVEFLENIPVMLSIPSSFSLPWSKYFCKILKENHPRIKIVAGGRWVIGHDTTWLKRIIPQIDLIVPGIAEHIIENIIDINKWPSLNYYPNNFDNIITFPRLSYNLVDQFLEYNPSIEISRGCGLGCAFCSEKDANYQIIKTPKEVAEDIRSYISLYQSDRITPYFESSIFRPSNTWIKEFSYYYNQMELKVKWRSETRINSISLKNISRLANSGLKVLDLGLESASHKQLFRMNKTKNPGSYLKHATIFLKECYENDIWVKINILLYAGETSESINETCEWLDKNKKYFKGVSVGPLILYRDISANSFIDNIKSLGADLVSFSDLEDRGYCNLHLSKEIDFGKSISVSQQISQYFMSYIDYFQLKSFSYFPRTFSIHEFISNIMNDTSASFSFNIDGLLKISKEIPNKFFKPPALNVAAIV